MGKKLSKGVSESNPDPSDPISGDIGNDKKNSDSTEGEIIPFYRKHEFTLYRTWLSLPGFLKGKDITFLEKAGIDDPTMIDLLGIKTQTQFAAKYDLNIDTLTKWNKYIWKHYDVFEEIKSWSSKLTKNIVGATYNSALQRDPKANADRKLFLQLQGWVEKSEQTINQTNYTELLKQKLENGRRRKKEREANK